MRVKSLYKLLQRISLTPFAEALGHKSPAVVEAALSVTKNIIEYVINIVDNDEVKPEDLPSYVLEAGQNEADTTIHMLPPGTALEAGDDGHMNHDARQGWPDIEKQMIMEALLKAGGRKNRAAAA